MPTQPKSHSQRMREKLGKTFKPQRKDFASVAVRNSHRWNVVRARVRTVQPICADPLGAHAKHGRIEPTEEIHHIVPLEVDRGLAYEQSNLVGLCRWCHTRIEGMNRAGQPTKHLFDTGGRTLL